MTSEEIIAEGDAKASAARWARADTAQRTAAAESAAGRIALRNANAFKTVDPNSTGFRAWQRSVPPPPATVPPDIQQNQGSSTLTFEGKITYQSSWGSADLFQPLQPLPSLQQALLQQHANMQPQTQRPPQPLPQEQQPDSYWDDDD